MREKERRGNVTILVPHLCFKVAPCSSYRESLELSLPYTSGNFIIELGLYIPTTGFLKCPRSSGASKLDAHPISFSLSFHTLIDPVHPWHGSPYSSHSHQLMGISITRSLAASMWDFLHFCLLHTTSTIIFYSTYSAISMAHAHVLRESWKGLRMSKVWNSCLACHRGCAWCEYFVWWRWSIARLYDFVGMSFLWLCYFNKT